MFSCVIMLILSIWANLLSWNKLIASKDLILAIPTIALLIPLILFPRSIIDLLSNKLIFNEDGLLVTGGIFKENIQHRAFIYYAKIKDIRMIYAHMDSKGKPIKNTSIASMRPHMFFEFILNDDTSKFLHIEIYSIKQRKTILNIINSKTGKNFSYDTIEKLDKSIYSGLKKKKAQK